MLFDAPEFSDHEQVVFARDAASGLKAIIALHSTALGPAAGGCRIYPYADDAAALTDVLRLSRAMTFKNAMAGLPLGGGKSVIIADPAREKTPMLLHAMGQAIDRLGGRYFTGEDVGTSADDMVEIRKGTRHVMGLPESAGGAGDPSPKTAFGCFEGIRAAVRYKLGQDGFDGLHVAIQGLGNVGMNLARLLAQAGASLTVSDIRAANVEEAVRLFGAKVVSSDEIYDVQADIFAPCAMGAILNDGTIPRLKVSIVAGAANNQLATPGHGIAMQELGILYAPDYVINAGGVIQIGSEMTDLPADEVTKRLHGIGDTLMGIFSKAEAEGIATSEASDRIAESRIRAVQEATATAA